MEHFRNSHKSRFLQILVLVVLIPLIIMGVYLVGRPTELTPQAKSVRVALGPAVITKKVGEDFVINLSIDPGDKDIVAADFEIEFDPIAIEIKPNDLNLVGFRQVPVKKVDLSNGVIKLSGLAFDSSTNQIVGGVRQSMVVVALPFKARAGKSSQVELKVNNMLDSSGAVVSDSNFSSVRVNISGSSDNPSPSDMSELPIADYEVEGAPNFGTNFKIVMTPRGGRVEDVAIMIDGDTKAYPVTLVNNSYKWTNVDGGTGLANGKHIVQLAGGCTQKGSTYDCKNAPLGFNPYVINVQDATSVRSNDPANPDLNNDGQINARDISSLISSWGKMDDKRDLNGDQVVDVRDMGVIIQRSK